MSLTGGIAAQAKAVAVRVVNHALGSSIPRPGLELPLGRAYGQK
jgi:hypothetical protein